MGINVFLSKRTTKPLAENRKEIIPILTLRYFALKPFKTHNQTTLNYDFTK